MALPHSNAIYNSGAKKNSLFVNPFQFAVNSVDSVGYSVADIVDFICHNFSGNYAQRFDYKM